MKVIFSAKKPIFNNIHSDYHAYLTLLSIYDRKLWLAVFEIINATYTEAICINGSHSKYYENYTVDIEAVSYLLYYGRVARIYPLYMETIVFVVPEALPYPEFAAYMLTITSDSFFGYSLITIAGVMHLLCIFRYIKHKKILIFRSVTDVACLLMNENGFIKYQQLSRIENLLIVPLTFAGLIIVNGLLSILQSYLTRPIIQPEIKTIEDIYKSPYPIFSLNVVFASLANEMMRNHFKRKDWTDRVLKMDYYIYPKLYESSYESVSLLLELSDAKRLLRVEKKMNMAGHYIPPIRIFSTFMSHSTSKYFPFIERLNDIINWARSAGLTEKWYADYSSFHENDDLQYYRHRKNIGLQSKTR